MYLYVNCLKVSPLLPMQSRHKCCPKRRKKLSLDFCRLRLRMKLPYCLSLLRTNVPIFSAFVCIVVAVAEIYLFDFAVVVHCFDISLTLLLMMLKDTSLNNIRVLFVFVV